MSKFFVCRDPLQAAIYFLVKNWTDQGREVRNKEEGKFRVLLKANSRTSLWPLAVTALVRKSNISNGSPLVFKRGRTWLKLVSGRELLKKTTIEMILEGFILKHTCLQCLKTHIVMLFFWKHIRRLDCVFEKCKATKKRFMMIIPS